MKRLAVIFAFLLVVMAAVMVGGYLAFGPDSSAPRKPVVATQADAEPEPRTPNEPDAKPGDQGHDDQPTEPGPENTPGPDPAADGNVPDPDRPTTDADNTTQPENGKVEAEAKPVTDTITIAGRILDDEGNPVHAATVTLYYDATGKPAGDGGRPLQKMSVARTDGDGYYRGEAKLTFPGEGQATTVILQAQKEEGLHSDDVKREVKPGSVHGNVDMVIPSGSVLTGRVVNQQFEPVADAIVSAQWTDGEKVGSTIKTRADDQGNFRVEGMRTGTYLLRVTAQGYQPAEDAREVEMDAGVDQELKGDLVLKPVTGLRLQLTSALGQPSGDFKVTFYNAEGKATDAKGRADNEGKALISPAPADAVEMEIEMSGYEKSERLAVFIIKDDHTDLGQVALTSLASDGD